MRATVLQQQRDYTTYYVNKNRYWVRGADRQSTSLIDTIIRIIISSSVLFLLLSLLDLFIPFTATHPRSLRPIGWSAQRLLDRSSVVLYSYNPVSGRGQRPDWYNERYTGTAGFKEICSTYRKPTSRICVGVWRVEVRCYQSVEINSL